MSKSKMPERICVLVGRQVWQPFSFGACRSLEHGHMDRAHAERLVDDGSAEYLFSTVTDKAGDCKLDAAGKPKMKKEPAVRLLKAKRWKGVLSDRGSSRPMKVMQLVSG